MVSHMRAIICQYSRLTHPKTLVFQETPLNRRPKGIALGGPGWEELTKTTWFQNCRAEVAQASEWHKPCLRGLLAPPGWERMG